MRWLRYSESYSKAFRYSESLSIFEVLLCLAILSICVSIVIKTRSMEHTALRQASVHIQSLQQQLNEVAYYAFLQKSMPNNAQLQNLLQNASITTKLFSFQWKRDYYLLQIGQKRLIMRVRLTPMNHYSITCNPSQQLCRQLYHRKHAK